MRVWGWVRTLLAAGTVAVYLTVLHQAEHRLHALTRYRRIVPANFSVTMNGHTWSNGGPGLIAVTPMSDGRSVCIENVDLPAPPKENPFE